MYLITAIILFVAAVLCFVFPQCINVLSAQQKKQMNRRKVGVAALIGLSIPAVLLLVFHCCGIYHELLAPLVVIPCAIGTAVAIQIVAK